LGRGLELSEPAKKGRTRKQKKEPEPKLIAKEKAPKPTGAPPTAIVEVRHGGSKMRRQAKGYSLGEVAQANLSVGQARGWGVLVDGKRRSVLEENVEALKKWTPRTRKPAEERVEGEVRKIERAVEKEVRRVEKEAKKVEEEAKKVEEEVVEKVEAPVKRRARKKPTQSKTAD
jgi:large subunit ribosomal protein L13e